MANYKYQTIDGVIVPDTSAILIEVQDEFRQAFGQDLIVTPDTPQGVLIAAEALARSLLVANNAQLANQINPNIAGGKYLDGIMALTGMTRNQPRKSTVTAILTGVRDTIIPEGAQARTLGGDLFETASTVVIGAGGTVYVDFRAVEVGAVPIPANSLTQVVSDVLGWETVNNPTAGVLGALTQSDRSARALRRNTLAFQGVALVEAITSALYAVEGVRSLTFLENQNNTSSTVEGVTLVPHSIYACVDGGLDQDIAKALLENKSSGANWNGEVAISLVEPASKQTYTVRFSRPTVVPVALRITVRGGTADDVISAVMAYARGEQDGEAGLIVGAEVSTFEIAGAINRALPQVYVQKVEASLLPTIVWSTAEISILISQIASFNPSNITVVVL